MNKVFAISLVILWCFYCFFREHEYSWVIRTLLGLNLGYASACTWMYNDFKNMVLKDLNIHLK